MPTKRSCAAMAFLSFALSGCPTASAPPPAECTERFVKCTLPDGPLGVCTDVPCDEPGKSGCLGCQSQH
jgi:hypothetical protein